VAALLVQLLHMSQEHTSCICEAMPNASIAQTHTLRVRFCLQWT
jgi:hypothetical protein